MPTDGDLDGMGLLAKAGAATHSTEFYSPLPAGYVKGRHKYVVVMGTVMSGLGKGIFASSLARMLKDKGLCVAPIKMEGYLNIDSGTLNPYRHGEVFVLDDGTECDMDLGTYERMLDQNLSTANFTTSGRIYSEILNRERQGVYLGRDVQMIPHVTGEVKRTLRQLAMRGDGERPADVVFIEVGGTVGDYENLFYIEALRELAFEEGHNSVCFVALTYVIEPPTLGEQKSKPAQLGIKRLLETGIQPQIIACRASRPVQPNIREKIAMFSNVPLPRVFSMHDRQSIYQIPEEMRSEGLDREILSLLDLHGVVDSVHEDHARQKWSAFTSSLRKVPEWTIEVGITGKYAELRDAYASIEKALEHCAAHFGCRINQRWLDTSRIDATNVTEQLKGVDAIIVPGGFGSRGIAGKLEVVRHVREGGIPYLGICLGFQVAVVEFARHVIRLPDASSAEWSPDGQTLVISELPEQKKIEGLGGTMRLGGQAVQIAPGTLASFLFRDQLSIDQQGTATVRERFRHRYEVEPAYIERLEAGGMIFSGRHPSSPIMQVLELPFAHHTERAETDRNPVNRHPYFVAAQFHPELTSRPLRPQPMFLGLVAAALHHQYANQESQWKRLRELPMLKRWLRDELLEPQHA
jgi:CTP synthase